MKTDGPVNFCRDENVFILNTNSAGSMHYFPA
jgi:hypothetical protein